MAGVGIERVYDFSGREVRAKILESHSMPTGAIEILVQTSCLAPDGQLHHQTNSATLTDGPNGSQFETYMTQFASWLQTLLWDKPTVTLFFVELETPGGKRANLMCSFNVSQPFTIISPDWVRLAELPQTGVFNPPENPNIAFPVHRAKLYFGKRLFDVNVVAANANTQCVVGADLISQAVGQRTELIFDLFRPDLVRALVNATRLKQSTVLVLGSYKDEGRRKLENMRSALAESGQVGVILDEFVDIHEQSLFEKMLMFGSLARFVICDESAASGHLIELKACSELGL